MTLLVENCEPLTEPADSASHLLASCGSFCSFFLFARTKAGFYHEFYDIHLEVARSPLSNATLILLQIHCERYAMSLSSFSCDYPWLVQSGTTRKGREDPIFYAS